MNSFFDLFWTITALTALVAVLVATVKMTRDDRSHLPPGSPRDWRDDAMSWNRLPIR